MPPKILLFILVGVVPLIVLTAGIASVLLLRAGYGFWVWGVLPFLGSLFVVVVVSAFFGRAAGGGRTPPSGEDGEEGSGRVANGDKDGV